MSARTVLMWRHGQTPWNKWRRLQGQADIDLDDVGVGQAREAASVLAGLGPTAIVSSDLVRARRTAEALGEVTGLPVALDQRLRERGFGDWEGLDHAEIEGGWADAYQVWRSGGHPEGLGIEERGEVGQRVAAAVAAHAEPLEEDATLVIVAHGAAISAGIATLLGMDAETWNGVSGLGNCHWSVLHPNHSAAPAWRLHGHNIAPVG